MTIADEHLRPIHWVGSTYKDLVALPKQVQRSFGIRLNVVQRGATPPDTKPLPQFGTGVFELRERFDKNAYRLMYAVKLSKAIYVLHVFMKKSKSGTGLPTPDAALIVERLKRASKFDREE